MTFGVSTLDTHDPYEIRGYTGLFELLPVTIEEGRTLEAGRVIGMRPTTDKFMEYDNDAAASATSPAYDGENSGNATCSAVTVDDDETLTEDWVLTCTAAVDGETGAIYSVVGSVSGNVGNAETGVEFSDDSGMVTFTLTEGMTPSAPGDIITFDTTAAGAGIAMGILSEDVDASDGDKISAMYVRGNFVESRLTGLDDNAKIDLSGRSACGYFLI